MVIQELIAVAHAPLVGNWLGGLDVMLGLPVVVCVCEGVEKVLVGVVATGVKEETKELLDVS